MTGQRIGYIRISSFDQNTDRQLRGQATERRSSVQMIFYRSFFNKKYSNDSMALLLFGFFNNDIGMSAKVGNVLFSNCFK